MVLLCLLETWRSFLGKLYLLWPWRWLKQFFGQVIFLMTLKMIEEIFWASYIPYDLEDDWRGFLWQVVSLITLKMIEEVILASYIPYNLEDDWRGDFDKLYLLWPWRWSKRFLWQVVSLRTLKMIEKGSFFFFGQVESVINLKMIEDGCLFFGKLNPL